MFNDLKVSNSISGQFPTYLATEYPNFVNFLKDYYRFMETNGNPLDLLNGVQKLVDIDTYSGVNLTAQLKTPVPETAEEIVVLNHVNFPRVNGLLKINDEVIFYKERDHITDEFGSYKLTVFSGCVRGFTYNDLDIDTGFTANIETTPALHSATSTVYNQSYQYILYFLEKIRQQYLVDFPKNVLEDNIDKVNINVILQKVKDFYLTKGTPAGIDFYFKFLFQENPELLNYSDFLMTSSDAIYQSKEIVRVTALDQYFTSELEGNSLIQLGNEFPVQTVEDVFSSSSQVFELEISNGDKIVPTNFTKITRNISGITLYVDSTYGFPDSGFIRVGDDFVQYTSKGTTYFTCPNIDQELSALNYLGIKVYDVSTLASIKDRPDIYYIIYAGVSDFEINKNYTYYQQGDIGFISDIIVEDSLIVTGWYLNDIIPVKTNQRIFAGVKAVYTDEESLYLSSTGVPYYSISSTPNYFDDNNLVLESSDYLKRIPKNFFKNPQGLEELTVKSNPVGFLRDGTAILNWKSSTSIDRGEITNIEIDNPGQDYRVDNPPEVVIEDPLLDGGVTAVADIVVNGKVSDVYILDGGNGYTSNVSVNVIKDPTDTKYTGSNFRAAVLQPIVVNGKITKIRIIDPGQGYTKLPTIRIKPFYNRNIDTVTPGTPLPYDAKLELLVSGEVGEIKLTNKGSRYDRNPSLQIKTGSGASGVVNIENGRITNAEIVNNGQNYNSPPLVRIIDASGKGVGGVIISELNVSGQLENLKVLNGGINYSQVGTRIELFESGSNLVADPQVSKWNLLTNWDTSLDPFYSDDTGGVLYGNNIIQEQATTIPRFEAINYGQWTDSTELTYVDGETGEVVNTRRMLLFPAGDAHEPGATPINLNPASPPLEDTLLSNLAVDLIDEASISFQIPFEIRLGTSSTNPSGSPEDGWVNVNSNGFITFSAEPRFNSTGWATEQLDPLSIGPSIQIGRDDLILDQLYTAIFTDGGDDDTRYLVLRFEGYHFDRGLSRDRAMVFELIIKENKVNTDDNQIQLTIINNETDDLDDAGIYITFADDEEYEFEKKGATSLTTYKYFTQTIGATDVQFGKQFGIIGAPKKLSILEGRTPIQVNLADATEHSPLIGWAMDGAPIYGPYGYDNPLNEGSGIKKMKSRYRKLTVSELNAKYPIRLTAAPIGLQNYAIGSFEQDYIVDPTTATLDEKNGRYCVTPEFENGVYAYFMTVDLAEKRTGFPFFVGSKFSGKTYAEFNNLDTPNIEEIKGIKRYTTSDGDTYPRPIDVGQFQVSSVPTSGDAVVESINVISGGSGYKFGDLVEFNNAGTDGEGSAGFVSVIKGQPISSASFDYYDYLEYTEDTFPFQTGSVVESFEGFKAKIHVADQINKRLYLTNADDESDIVGPLPTKGIALYDQNLSIDVDTFSETVGETKNSVALNADQTTAELTADLDSVSTYFQLTNFNNCVIQNFFASGEKKYVKIGDEYMRVVFNFTATNHIIVKRGFNSQQTSHSAGDTVTLLYSIDIFDSSAFVNGDVVKIDDEIFRIVDIDVQKQFNVVSTRIVDGSGTFGGSIYYLYLNQQIQSDTGAITPPPQTQQVVKLDTNGDIEDLVFDKTAFSYTSNPTAEITTQSTYNADDVVEDTNILASTFRHTIIVDRSAFNSIAAAHTARTPVNRLKFVNAVCTKYEEDRILFRASAQNNLLVPQDAVTIKAQLEADIDYTITYQEDVNGNNVLNGITNNALLLYEGSHYTFEIGSGSQDVLVQFYTPGETTKQKEYFSVNIEKSYDLSGALTQFIITPSSSNLTNLILRITSLENNTFVDVDLTIRPEPVNGEYRVVNATSSFFEVYIDRDPIASIVSSYNSTNLKYTTTSTNTNGTIERVTLTSGGFNYSTIPEVSGVTSENGNGAILEAVSSVIGRIDNISSINSGYGYSPDPTLKPSLIFPRIAKLTQNFIVSSTTITDSGEGYLYTPRIRITGGGLAEGDEKHAKFIPIVNGEKLVDLKVDFEGVQYSSAPVLEIEKFYYVLINANGDLSFKFNYRQYIQEDDGFVVRAYYEDGGGNPQSVDSSVTFYAFVQTSTMSARLIPGSSNFVNPLDYITIPGNAAALYYEVILNNRKAQVTANIEKSTFILGEKVVVNGDKSLFGFVSNNKGWQPNNSILRIEKINYELKAGDSIVGVDSSSFGVVSETFGVSSSASLAALVETPKQFLSTKSFLGLNSLKIQDSLRYQKFAYEIGTKVPLVDWKQNYQTAVHPTGYNFFAKTNVNNAIKNPITLETKAVISTDASSIVRINQKYNYLITRNIGFDEVEVINRLLTDVKSIDTSVVAAFEDISDQFDGIETAFELKVIDPVTPQTLDENNEPTGVPNYITDYEVDQMLVSLDNIIQTYGTSWIVTDSDKVFKFEASQIAGELLPEGEKLTYRQFNEDTAVYIHSETTTSETDTFTLYQTDEALNTSMPAGVFSPVVPTEWMVSVDGATQLTTAYTITTNQIVFSETLPIGTQISIRYLDNFMRTEFSSGSVTAGSAVNITTTPPVTSPESYFIFVDGVLMSTSLYSLDVSNNVVFNISFNYDSLIVIIDPLGVSLETRDHNIIEELYSYKIDDGQLVIPAGYSINAKSYMVDVAGVVQTPNVAYATVTSGVRKINFFEPPQRYTTGDITVGRQFIGLLYQRLDPTGVNSTPNYQFDDVSKNIINVKTNPSEFIVGDYVNTPVSSGLLVDIVSENIRKVMTSSNISTVAAGATFQIDVDNIIGLVVGDRVLFNASFGLTSIDSDELEITNISGLTITLENISASSLNISMNLNSAIRFTHYEIILEQIETTEANRDDAFNSVASGSILESGIISATKTGVSTLLNEPFSVLNDDTTIDVDDASNFAQNDYLLINNVEAVKVTNISGNVLTVDRAQLTTSIPISYGDNTVVEKIIPKTIETSNFSRGFDGFKTEFKLKESGADIFIEANKDIFVIVNGILQKRGQSYTLVETDPTPGSPGSGDEFSKLVFTEAPPDGAPFNCFYVGELISIQDISNQFNGVDIEFDLRSVTGEVFSLISNGRVEANVAANLILFMDGVYQIPSTTEIGRIEAYPDSLASFKLLGSIIQFTSPPKKGSEFEGYIYVGSTADYKSIDIDASVESGDILVQSNEIEPRDINNVTSARKLSVGISAGQKNNDIPNGQNLGGDNGTGWFKADLIKSARIRESLRVRRTIVSEILGFAGSSPYPLLGKTLPVLAIASIELQDISEDLPEQPDDDTNQVSFVLPATTNFPKRVINAQYTSFVPRNSVSATPGDTGAIQDKIQGVKVGYDLSFDQIVKLNSSASGETFESEILNGITYAGNTAKIINWDITNQILYLKLDAPLSPVNNGDTIKTYSVIQDDLINEYQSLALTNKFYYNF